MKETKILTKNTLIEGSVVSKGSVITIQEKTTKEKGRDLIRKHKKAFEELAK